ncbi:hypothetical protein [Candidatus Methanoperedens nitratireducens]|uniref:Uncharacterized protein n=1 Tax=Candidatus Methanoperedens nitratireducens TaxID=1392998 RepID=A0A284VJE4_9EURY|nr:hypothetical protein [Candidatus Methanoperedens nitroreducens]SNQ59394.1 conserved hypothetical protein [Candidatus Methanoperedens nitroreducens]
MTIQIDDQGWGTPVGGVGIIVLRKETGEMHYDIISIEDFRVDTFKKKIYLVSARNIVEQGFVKLRIQKDEGIEICSGCIHDKTAEWLKNEGYKFTVTKINGLAQQKGEELFIEYLRGLGVPNPPGIINETVDEYKAQFFYLMDWVREDPNGRKHLCKTGWKYLIKFFKRKNN